MDASNRVPLWVEYSILALVLFFQIGLPALHYQECFLFGVTVWLWFFIVGSHLIWRVLGARLRRFAKVASVLVFGLVVLGFTYPGLSRQYTREHPKPPRVAPPSIPLPAAKPHVKADQGGQIPPSGVHKELPSKEAQSRKEAHTRTPDTPSAKAGISLTAPIVVEQDGQNNISQIGSNNQATIVAKEHLLLTAAQESVLTKELRGFGGRSLKIMLQMQTVETTEFGQGLAAALREAGIDVRVIPTFTQGVPIPSGISFQVSDATPDLPFVNAIAGALIKAGVVKAPIEYSRNGDEAVPLIYITPY
jgi:hypothetical protein